MARCFAFFTLFHLSLTFFLLEVPFNSLETPAIKNHKTKSLETPTIKNHKTNSLETLAMKSTQTAVYSERTADLEQKNDYLS